MARTSKMPTWVKGFLWAGLVAAIGLTILLATGHGPWEHMQMGGVH
jgi:hypothetical protein